MATASECAQDSAVCVKRSDGAVQDLASITTQKLLLSGMNMCGYGHPSLPPSLHCCPHLSLLTLTASSIIITSYHLLITPLALTSHSSPSQPHHSPYSHHSLVSPLPPHTQPSPVATHSHHPHFTLHTSPSSLTYPQSHPSPLTPHLSLRRQ